ncbi:MAG: sulfatase-like hydrolase/transferase [Actinomycetota bacterium]
MSRVRHTLSGESLRELLLGGAHLGALWAFALVQPLLDLLGKNPDFFVARGNTAGDIVLFSVAFTFLPPLAMLAVETVAKVIDRRAYLAVHMGFVVLLAATFFVQIEKRIFSKPAGLMIVIGLALGALIAYGLYKRGFVKQLLDVLTPAPLVFLVLFLFFSDTNKLILPQEDAGALGVKVQSKTPVVMLIFDELPTATLMDPSAARVDAKRFPGFASLAAQSTWYRNNSAAADFTGRAVPAIMTGVSPDFTTLPTSSDQPNSIFSLLGGKYRMHVDEVVTSVCDPSLCGEEELPPQKTRLKDLVKDLRYVEGRLVLPPALANELPNVSSTFGNFGNNAGDGAQYAGQFARDLFVPPSPEQFNAFFSGIKPGGRSFNLIHIELPHEPFHFLPDGREYNFTEISDIAGPNAQSWAATEGGVATTLQRHFIQTGYADRLTRQMIARLKEVGIWDKALVIVTADHGISFDPKDKRRIATPTNLGGVGNPPLFIKYPGQRKPELSDAYTRNVDIVPTIADVLGVEIPYKVDGVPVSEAGKVDRQVEVTTGLKTTVTEPFPRMLAERDEVLRRDAAWVGTGSGLFELGPRPDLLGRPVPPISGPAAGPLSAEVYSPDVFKTSLAPGLKLPAFAAATLEGVEKGREIAIAVNGKVAATATSFLFYGDIWAGAVVPPDSLRPGQNSVGFYLVEPSGQLTPLGGT